MSMLSSDERDAGSPPRAWGRPRAYRVGAESVRFTPTCVGTARLLPALGPAQPVHPHVRGDGYIDETHEWAHAGSPPRAWGRPMSAPRTAYPLRFTPTCVGTASARNISHASFSVHPHVRGDGAQQATISAALLGSPPRAWGRLCASCPTPPLRRFTPTCVGTARSRMKVWLIRSVHPHVRGDGYGTPHDFSETIGSPPRAWGRRMPMLRFVALVRFTPTCVGTAQSPCQ